MGAGGAGRNKVRGWGGLKCGQALQMHRPPTGLGTQPIPSLLGREQGSIPSQEETTLCAHLSFLDSQKLLWELTQRLQTIFYRMALGL